MTHQKAPHMCCSVADGNDANADDADTNGVADGADDADDVVDASDADDAVAKLNMCGNQDILRGTTLEWKSPPLVN